MPDIIEHLTEARAVVALLLAAVAWLAAQLAIARRDRMRAEERGDHALAGAIARTADALERQAGALDAARIALARIEARQSATEEQTP